MSLPLFRLLRHITEHTDATRCGTHRFYNLEVRDHYFSRLKGSIEFNLKINGRKTVLVSHSMGSSLLLVRLSRGLSPFRSTR